MRLRVRLAWYWFFGAGALGFFFPYFSLYLRENVGLAPFQVGVVIAVPPLVGLFAQPLWGQIADRSGSRARTLSLVCVGTGLGFVALSVPSGFLAALLCTAFFASFSTGLNPLGTSVSLGALDDQAQSGFGRVRVFGTIGFLCAIVAAPALLELALPLLALVHARPRAQSGLGLLLLLGALFLWIAAFIAWRLPRNAGLSVRAAPRDYLLLLHDPAYRRVLLFTFLSYLSLHGPMMMFPIYVRERGGDVDLLSRMWIGMLLVEIPLMIYSGAIFKRLGPRRMLALATAAGGLRWGVCGFTAAIGLIFAMQLLHAVVVTGVLVGGALYVESLVPPGLRATAQAGLTMVGGGLGGIVASLLAGLVLERFGVDVLFVGSGALGLLTALLGAWLLPTQRRLQHAAGLQYAPAEDEAA